MFTALKTAVADYTATVITEIQPDIIQSGNEIDSGLLWPKGNLIEQESQCLELLSVASTTIRTHRQQLKL